MVTFLAVHLMVYTFRNVLIRFARVCNYYLLRTEELTKCYEPLQKLRVRLWLCKIDLSPPVILYYLSFQGDTSVVVLFVLSLGV